MNRTSSQFSLRELLLAILVVGMGLTGLRLGGIVASLLVFVAIVALMGAAIVAFVGRGEGQAMAIGCLIPAIAYSGCIFVAGNRELDPYGGKLPTSQILRPVFEAFSRHKWVNLATGEVLADDHPAVTTSGRGGGGFGGGGMQIGFSESPERLSFMTLGHCLFAITFAYAGAKFALFVHRRRKLDAVA